MPTYNELVLVARQEDLRSRGDVIRRFVQALARGAQAVKRDPALGADAMIKADKNLDRDLLLASIKATLPVFFPADPSSRGAIRTRTSGRPTGSGWSSTA